MNVQMLFNTSKGWEFGRQRLCNHGNYYQSIYNRSHLLNPYVNVYKRTRLQYQGLP